MLKKATTLLLCVLLSSFSFAQNNEINVINRNEVSTDPQNKKILLEEFTGIHCGNCMVTYTDESKAVAAYLLTRPLPGVTFSTRSGERMFS